MECNEHFDVHVPEVGVRLHLAHVVFWRGLVNKAFLAFPCLNPYQDEKNN